MAVTRRFRIIGISAAALFLVLLACGFQVWARAALRARPWHLEDFLASRISECRTAPEAFVFAADCSQLEVRADEVERRLAEESQRWEFTRNYSVHTYDLLTLCQDAHLLKLRMALRRQDQLAKVTAILATLRCALDCGVPAATKPFKFRLRSLEQDRALSLADQANRLRAIGDYSSALESALRALVAWQRFVDEGREEFARFGDQDLLEQWDRQAEDLLNWTKESGRRAILVVKLEHRCLLLSRGQVEKSYTVNLGRNWYRPKVQAQDASTPEGEYKITRLNPAGRYGFALMLDYPNGIDQARFHSRRRSRTIPSGARIGGNIEIHGGGRPQVDWTDGCVSLDDVDMRELFRLAYPGMPVTIVGTARITSSGPDRPGAS